MLVYIEKSKAIIYRPNDDDAGANDDGLQLPKVTDPSTGNYRPTENKSIKYEVDPVHIAAHEDYQKWVKLSGPDREQHGIIGDPICHFFRLHENKVKVIANRQPSQTANHSDNDYNDLE